MENITWAEAGPGAGAVVVVRAATGAATGATFGAEGVTDGVEEGVVAAAGIAAVGVGGATTGTGADGATTGGVEKKLGDGAWNWACALATVTAISAMNKHDILWEAIGVAEIVGTGWSCTILTLLT